MATVFKCKKCGQVSPSQHNKCPYCKTDWVSVGSFTSLDTDSGTCLDIHEEAVIKNYNQSSNTPAYSSYSHSLEKPILSMFFNILAVLAFIGGCILCAKMWPDAPEYGYEWKPIIYLPSIACFTAGVVQGAVYLAIGQVLTYLHQIANKCDNNFSKESTYSNCKTPLHKDRSEEVLTQNQTKKVNYKEKLVVNPQHPSLYQKQSKRESNKDKEDFVGKREDKLQLSNLKKISFSICSILILLVILTSLIHNKTKTELSVSPIVETEPSTSPIVESQFMINLLNGKYSANILQAKEIDTNSVETFVEINQKLDSAELQTLSDRIHGLFYNYETVYVYFMTVPYTSLDTTKANGTAHKIDGVKEKPSINW